MRLTKNTTIALLAMAEPSKHPATINLDRCWVCESRFIGFGGTESVEHHHVIPRNSGGTDGPTVSICDSDHTKAHHIAQAMKGKKSYFTFINNLPEERTKRLLYLAQMIVNAELVTKNDPNKSAVAVLTLDRQQKLMIDRLKSFYNLSSREKVLSLALEKLYNKHFTDNLK